MSPRELTSRGAKVAKKPHNFTHKTMLTIVEHEYEVCRYHSINATDSFVRIPGMIIPKAPHGTYCADCADCAHLTLSLASI